MRSPQDLASEMAYLIGRLNEADVYAPEAVPLEYKVEGDPGSGILLRPDRLPKSLQIANLWRKYRKVKEEFDEVKATAKAKAAEETALDTTTEEALETTTPKETPETTTTATEVALETTTPPKETPETTAREITPGALQTKARKVAFQEPDDDGSPIS